jgi:hypothetical protein
LPAMPAASAKSDKVAKQLSCSRPGCSIIHQGREVIVLQSPSLLE